MAEAGIQAPSALRETQNMRRDKGMIARHLTGWSPVYYFYFQGKSLVGVRGFEPPAPASRTQCSTRLSYTPMTVSGLYPSQAILARAETQRSVILCQIKAVRQLRGLFFLRSESAPELFQRPARTQSWLGRWMRQSPAPRQHPAQQEAYPPIFPR